MAFDFSQLSALQQYLTSNLWVLADIVFVGYSLYNVIMHFNIGMIGTLLRFVSYVVSYFIAKWATYQACASLGITSTTSLAVIAVAIFIGAGYILYKNLRYIMPGSMSIVDSMIGAIYGVLEVLFFVFLINSICIYVNKNGFGVPEWILIANNVKPDHASVEKPEILYKLISFARSKTDIVVPAEQVNKWMDYIKSELTEQVVIAKKKADDVKTEVKIETPVAKPSIPEPQITTTAVK